MLTSIALQKLRSKGFSFVYSQLFQVIHRYWSVYERHNIFKLPYSFLHFPADKVFFSKIDLNASTLKDLLKHYVSYNSFQRVKVAIRTAKR